MEVGWTELYVLFEVARTQCLPNLQTHAKLKSEIQGNYIRKLSIGTFPMRKLYQKTDTQKKMFLSCDSSL